MPENGQRHVPCRVVLAVEANNFRVHVNAPRQGLVAQGGCVARPPMQGMVRVDVKQHDRKGAAPVVRGPHTVFAVHCIDLSLGGRWREERLDKELREAIQGTLQMRRRDVEGVARLRITCAGIALPAVPLQEPLVLGLVRIPRRAQEEHMLTKVSQPWHALGLVKLADTDAERRSCLVARRVGGQDHAEAVGKLEVFVAAVSVRFRLLYNTTLRIYRAPTNRAGTRTAKSAGC
mmetsp:Transcript_15795/g.34574  ORF Transcript_15795/g.34574 Transcript_15795/m.34574 type:complete len:233 (-) Transcript_15795:205-903(-)